MVSMVMKEMGRTGDMAEVDLGSDSTKEKQVVQMTPEFGV
jgi:hypothetical protein